MTKKIFATIIVVLALAGSVQAAEMLLLNKDMALLDAPDGRQGLKVLSMMRVSVLAEQGDNVKVGVSGWVRDGAAELEFKEPYRFMIALDRKLYNAPDGDLLADLAGRQLVTVTGHQKGFLKIELELWSVSSNAPQFDERPMTLGEKMRLYAEPGGKQLAIIRRNVEVTVTAEQDDIFRVRFDGWIKSDSADDEFYEPYQLVLGKKTRFKTKPGGSTFAALYKNQSVTVVDHQDGYLKVALEAWTESEDVLKAEEKKNSHKQWVKDVGSGKFRDWDYHEDR